MDKQVMDDAMATLDNMEQIAKAEMMVQGTYITDYVVAPERVDAICGGRQACLLGTMWIANGVPLDDVENSVGDDTSREEAMEERPSLKVVYDAMNEEAVKLSKQLGMRTHLRNWHSPAEALFELDRLSKDQVLVLINRTRKALTKVAA